MNSIYPKISHDDWQLKHPFGMMVCGPSQSGKTEFVRKLIDAHIINPAPTKVFWLYGQYQRRYEDPLESQVAYLEGFDTNVFRAIDGDEPVLVIIDDLMSEIGNSKDAAQIFTREVHHQNLSVIFIVQNIYHQGKAMRDISLNCQYFALFKNDRDVSQVMTLGKQLCPTRPKMVTEIYEKATSEPYGHLVIDVHPRSLKSLKFRAQLFKSYPIVYIPN